MKRSVKIIFSLLLVTLFLAMTVMQAAAAGATPTDPCGGKHDWDKGKLTKYRGCETPGEMTYTCRRCHKTKTQSLHALGHDWGEWEETENLGKLVEKRVCNRCGIYQLRDVEAKVLDAKNDEPSLSVELLSFNAPEIWLPGAIATGELKVTNTGDVLVVVTGYRICEENGQFCFNDKLEDWPQGSAILSPGDSFTLSIRVITLSAESAERKVVRTFEVSGETFRENETEHDPVASNTVTGTAEEVILPAALSIELLSFSGPKTIVSGSEITGELKVTNTGEVWVVATSYRICDDDGQFCFNDKLKDWPQGSAILAPSDSFTLSVHVTALPSDAEVGKVIRTFTVSGESLRENEKEHDAVTSNTVTGMFSCTPEDDALSLALLSLAAPKEAVSGSVVSGMLRATNTGSSVLSINYGLMLDENGGHSPNDTMGPFGADSFNMAPGASCDIPVSLTVSDENIEAGKAVRVFTLSALTVPQSDNEAVRKVTSNTVTGTVKFGEDASELFCTASLIYCHDGTYALKLTHCEEHTTLAAQARALQAQGQPAAGLWLDAIDALYEQLLSAVNSEADNAAIVRERDAFKALAEKYSAVLDDSKLCLLLEAKCADLCRLAHGEDPHLPTVDDTEADVDTDAVKRFTLTYPDDMAGSADTLFEAMLPAVLGKPDALDAAEQAVASLKEADDELGRAWADWADACPDMLAVFGCEPLYAPVNALTACLIAAAE